MRAGTSGQQKDPSMRTLLQTSAIGAAAFLASPAWAAEPSRPPSCSVENREARIVHSDPVEVPWQAKAFHQTGTSVLEIALAPNGVVTSAKIARSSGSRALDDAALKAVSNVSFAAEIVACRNVPGTYRLDVIFDN